MNNVNNKKIYIRWAGIYDLCFGSKYINNQRKNEIDMLNLKSGNKVLIVGIGTGEDLRFIPKDISVTGVDITEEMLDVARSKAKRLGIKNITIINMDGQNLNFPDNEFDYVILNLILSVIPDGNKCLEEAYRVLRKEGKVAVFDKFLDENLKLNIKRRILNKITMALGTDINRRFSDVLGNIKFKDIEEKRSILGGMYKIITLKK